MRQIELHIDPIPVDADGLAEAQAIAGAVALVLDGALIVGGVFTSDSSGTLLARQISITSDGADGARTFTVTGTDPDGKAQTEDITGVASTTIESVNYYKTVTSIEADAACAGNISSGTVDEFSTATIPVNPKHAESSLVSLERFTGAIDVTIQESFSRIQQTDSIEFGNASTSLQGQTSASNDLLTLHASACRVIGNSYTTGAELRVIINSNIG